MSPDQEGPHITRTIAVIPLAAAVFGTLAGVTAYAAPIAAAPPRALSVVDTPTTWSLSDGDATVSVQKSPWRMSLLNAQGTSVVSEQDPTAPDMTTNQAMQANKDFDQMGHDKAYPGLPTVSTEPMAYLRNGTWQHVTAFASAVVSGDGATVDVTTTDGTAVVTLALRGPAVDVTLTPGGSAAGAVGESFVEATGAHFYGGGDGFLSVDVTGLNLPMWVSHGVGADEYTYTHEIGVPYVASTAGWGMYERTGARGDFAVGIPDRPGVVSAIMESSTLQLTLYAGTLQQMLTAFTADEGRNEVPPQWAFTPIWWDDSQDTQAQIDANIAALQGENIPVGGYWIDNPFQVHQGDFAPDPARFPDFAGFVAQLHGQGIRLMAWVSPFYDPASNVAKAGAVPVTGGPSDNDDHTYVPARGLNPHVDLTDPTSYQAEVDAAAALLATGVDGFKLDRGEEDYADAAHFSDGTPNRLEHSRYVLAYDTAMRDACNRARPDDCFLLARGGVAGSSAQVANWAGDTLTSEGAPGLLSAVHSLLANAMSGQPVWGSDVGGYTGRQEGTSPTAGTFVRWAQFGAVSPIMESPNHPSAYDAQTVEAIKEAAVLHTRLAPYTEAAAQQAAATGVPIVQPLVLAYPDDAFAPTVDDEYVFDSCLLAAPLTTGIDQEGSASRSVYLPAGTWTNVFTGVVTSGPAHIAETSAYNQFPLYEDGGCNIPMSTFADLAAGVPPNVPESPAPWALVFVGVFAVGTAGRMQQARRVRG